MSETICTCCGKQERVSDEAPVSSETSGNSADAPCGEQEYACAVETPQRAETAEPEGSEEHNETPRGETESTESAGPSETPPSETPPSETPHSETPHDDSARLSTEERFFKMMDHNSSIRPRGLKLKKNHPPFPSGFTPPKSAIFIENEDGTRLPIFNRHLRDDIFQRLVESKYQSEIAAGKVKILEPSYELTFCSNCHRLSYCGEDDDGPSCVGCFLASNVDRDVGYQLGRESYIAMSDTLHALYFK